MPLTVVHKPSKNYNRRREPVAGIALHWTAGSYAASVDWVCSERSRVSYHAIIGPDGEIAQIVPWAARAWAIRAHRRRPSAPSRVRAARPSRSPRAQHRLRP